MGRHFYFRRELYRKKEKEKNKSGKVKASQHVL